METPKHSTNSCDSDGILGTVGHTAPPGAAQRVAHALIARTHTLGVPGRLTLRLASGRQMPSGPRRAANGMLRNALGERAEWQFDEARGPAGAAHMPIWLCCGEGVDVEQDYHPVLPFLQLLSVGEPSQASESGSCEEVSAGPDIQSHRALTRAQMKCGCLHRAQYARALHHMREAAGGIPQWDHRRRNSKLSVAAHRGRG